MRYQYRSAVPVTDHLLTLAQPVSYNLIWPPTGVPGFVHFGHGGAVISTGIAGGVVDVELYLLEAEPKLVTERWEDIDEGDLATEKGSIRLTGGLSAKNYIPGGKDGLNPTGPSLHRVRVSAIGRGLNYDLVTSDADISESYLIEMWPIDTPSETAAIKHDSGR